jgi:hypothetical protein
VTNIIYLILKNLVTPKARAKHEPLVQRTGHRPYLLKLKTIFRQVSLWNDDTTLSLVTLNITTQSIMTLSVSTLGIMTFSVPTLSIMALSITTATLSIMTLSITTLSIMTFSATIKKCDNHIMTLNTYACVVMLIVICAIKSIMLSVIMFNVIVLNVVAPLKWHDYNRQMSQWLPTRKPN